MSIDEKAKNIKLLILDVDGVLTSGHIFYDKEGAQTRAFHVHDGLGIKLLKKAGIDTAVISAKKSAGVEARLQELGLTHIFLGYETKLPAYETIKKTLQISDAEIAYMGDDLPDLCILKRVGLAATVPAGHDIIKEHADYISTKKGGKGAVRELCEFILKAKNQYQVVLESYLNT